ncbi:MAG: fasciclin domain-containing protein [Sphingobacteriales bacterium]|nr:fasciclin domain-containing protein [Sphingobacteriales bacterium]
MATILDIANADRNLSSMMKGIKAAKLEESLSGIGPFTILAPVNLAFGNLSAPDTFESMIKQSSSNSKLSQLLNFHVITGRKLVRDFRNGQKLPTVNGEELAVTVSDGEILINGAKILAKDRQGSNGVVHTINIVNLPTS